ncbi:MAG: hypothetical protein VX154_01500 [Pseudomonadota bacterium]|nr:hypothetical protein [Pseudomonadota bacterium]
MLSNKLSLTEDNMRIIRATVKGAPAADYDLLDQTVEKAAALLNVSHDDAERMLIKHIESVLAQKNAKLAQSWQSKVNTGESTVLHDDISFD